jgi:site-specific DNA recombinase
MDMENFLETVRRYTHVTKIARRMVSELIDPH